MEPVCLRTHNIAPHISSHNLPYHKTMKKYEGFPSMVGFSVLPRKFWIRTWFCICPQDLCLFHIVFECIHSIQDQGKMLVLPNRLLCFDGVHPHTQIRMTLFDGVRISIPNWKPSPNRAAERNEWVFDSGP